VVPDGDGVSLDDMSAFDEENEVVVNGPSSWEVVAATMTPTGTLVVVIKRLPDFVAFLTSPDDAHASAPAAAAAAACSSLAPLTSSDVAALVCSRGAAYTAYAAQFEKDGIDGTVLQNATMDELCDVMTAMNVTAVHKIALKAALQQWKQQPDAAVAMVAQQRQLMQAAAEAERLKKIQEEEERKAAAAKVQVAAINSLLLPPFPPLPLPLSLHWPRSPPPPPLQRLIAA
jgi:hypothetical protein